MSAENQLLPKAAIALGALGLIPFIVCALQITTAWPMGARSTGPALYALLLYSAAIISFLGGVHWGIALTSTKPNAQTQRFVASNLPTLAAWAAAWIGGRTGLLAMALTLALILAYEHWSAAQGETPQSYVKLRNPLTIIACAALLASAAFGPFA